MDNVDNLNVPLKTRNFSMFYFVESEIFLFSYSLTLIKWNVTKLSFKKRGVKSTTIKRDSAQKLLALQDESTFDFPCNVLA